MADVLKVNIHISSIDPISGYNLTEYEAEGSKDTINLLYQSGNYIVLEGPKQMRQYETSREKVQNKLGPTIPDFLSRQ